MFKVTFECKNRETPAKLILNSEDVFNLNVETIETQPTGKVKSKISGTYRIPEKARTPGSAVMLLSQHLATLPDNHRFTKDDAKAFLASTNRAESSYSYLLKEATDKKILKRHDTANGTHYTKGTKALNGHTDLASA